MEFAAGSSRVRVRNPTNHCTVANCRQIPCTVRLFLHPETKVDCSRRPSQPTSQATPWRRWEDNIKKIQHGRASPHSTHGLAVDCCENGNEPSDYITSSEHLSHYWLLAVMDK
jgi:hypothetical protein